jgi:hypothetical protein
MAETTVLKKPVDWDELYPGRFIKAGEFKGKKPTLTIKDVNLEELEGNKGKQIKGTIAWEETPKMLALNKTNGICLKAMFGKKLADWKGKKVTLFAAPYEGEEAIRVWGAPHLKEDIQVEIALPRKRSFNMTLHAVAEKPASREPGED